MGVAWCRSALAGEQWSGRSREMGSRCLGHIPLITMVTCTSPATFIVPLAPAGPRLHFCSCFLADHPVHVPLSVLWFPGAHRFQGPSPRGCGQGRCGGPPSPSKERLDWEGRLGSPCRTLAASLRSQGDMSTLLCRSDSIFCPDPTPEPHCCPSPMCVCPTAGGPGLLDDLPVATWLSPAGDRSQL